MIPRMPSRWHIGLIWAVVVAALTGCKSDLGRSLADEGPVGSAPTSARGAMDASAPSPEPDDDSVGPGDDAPVFVDDDSVVSSDDDAPGSDEDAAAAANPDAAAAANPDAAAPDECPDNPEKSEPGQCGCAVLDEDADDDGVLDCEDGCPGDADKTSPGICGCGQPDLDAELAADCVDDCPMDEHKTRPGVCGCGIADTDGDEDGVVDC
jgi:hypothetical protein